MEKENNFPNLICWCAFS